MTNPALFDPDLTPLESGENLIEANAGTGKTYTLCKIVERLIVDHAIPIERILAVTFTNAAAQELKDRIRKNLQQTRSKLTAEQSKEKILLSRALSNFDEARLYTLHAFCKRVLTEFSFECGVRPESELITDQSHLIEQVANDYKRSFFSLSNPFTGALSMTGKLTGAGLKEYYEDGQKEIPEEKYDWETVEEKAEQANNAYFFLVQTWSLEKESIKEFLETGARRGANHRKYFSKLDGLFFEEQKKVEAASFDSETEVNGKAPDFQLIKLIRSLFKEEVEAKEKAPVDRPSFFEYSLSFCNACEELENIILFLFLGYAEVHLEKLKSSLNLRTFDDLQKLVAEGLSGTLGNALSQKVFSQYDAALVDEFQDTDPLQFEILRKLFATKDGSDAKKIFYIGDPKQSIYRFRGADLNNYLDIKSGLSQEKIRSLITNYRTHPTLVEATNTFLTLNTNSEKGQDDENHLFLDKRIFFIKSKTSDLNAKEKEFNRLDSDLPVSPFNFRYLHRVDKKEKMEEIEQRILNDMSAEVIDLLDHQKKTYIGENLIQGSDIAVLCKDNKEADLIRNKFAEFQIPCVLLATRSIFRTDEANQFKSLMESLISPHDLKKIKRSLAAPLFGLTASEINELSEDPQVLDFWAERFFQWGELWKSKGFGYVLQNILNSDSFSSLSKKVEEIPLQERILREIGGERRLTNYLHLGEVLCQAEQEISSFPRNLHLWLVEQIETTPEEEESHARLESDEESVKILTIHKSKGLEFPITFLPFSWKVHPLTRAKEDFQENMRLLYVALTRASTRLYLYLYEPNNNFSKNGLSRCLSVDPLEVFEQLKSNPRFFNFMEVTDRKPQKPFSIPETNLTLQALEFNASLKMGGRCGSFSSKTKGIEKEKDLDEVLPLNKTIPKENRVGAHAFPAGTKAGNFFHAVFENIDFTVSNYDQVIKEQLDLHGLGHSHFQLAKEIIDTTLHAKLNKHDGAEFCLKEITKPKRLEELEFHLHADDFSFEELGRFLLKTDPGSAFAKYLISKKDYSKNSENLEFFKGFVDLTFKHDGKFFILDWKSNLLGGSQCSFASSTLWEEMSDADYLFQYHLYTLALHRFLSQNHSFHYQYDTFFGGVYYLFIRAMRNPENLDDGIFFDRPSRKIIESMDIFLGKKQ